MGVFLVLGAGERGWLGIGVDGESVIGGFCRHLPKKRVHIRKVRCREDGGGVGLKMRIIGKVEY